MVTQSSNELQWPDYSALIMAKSSGDRDLAFSVNIGQGNGLLPDGTKPLPKPLLYWLIISRVPWHSSEGIIIRRNEDTSLSHLNKIEIVFLKWHPDFPGVNPLRAKFFRGSINIYLYFVSFLHIDTTQVVEILPQIRQEPTFST